MIHTIALRRLLKEKLHPYELIFVQKPTEASPDRRIDFCEKMINRLNENEIALEPIPFFLGMNILFKWGGEKTKL